MTYKAYIDNIKAKTGNGLGITWKQRRRAL